MIPILGETVWSIIHGPATTGHLVEVSKFLKRPIDVWAEDRLMLFGRCHYRQKPRLHLKYKSLTNKCPSSSKAVGHFTLLQGHEPRNPDARSHPENCGFDVISDQTGYPATALRQVAVQRMLAKLYESRLRGRDHHFQCSRCGISGGEDWSREKVRKLIADSRYIHRGHAHVHVHRKNCEGGCACYTNYYMKNYDLAVIDCMQKYLIIFPLRYPCTITLFASDQDLEDCLVAALEGVNTLAACVCGRDDSCCRNIRIPPDHVARKGVLEKDVSALKKDGYEYDRVKSKVLDKSFQISTVKVVMTCYLKNGESAIGVDENLHLFTMYPQAIYKEKPENVNHQSVSIHRKKPTIFYHRSVSNSNRTRERLPYRIGIAVGAALNKKKIEEI